MVRVGFVIESTGDTMECLLNPISLVVRRTAGVVPERAPSGLFSRAATWDYPLLYTGGGTTEIDLELLFDAPLGASMRAQNSGATATGAEPDVRDLTAPFFNLSENAIDRMVPPIARFIWGKAWNVRGIVASVSERLERFSESGVPRRSWMSMRFLRVVDASRPAARAAAPPALDLSAAGRNRALDHVVTGSGPLTGALSASGDRIDTLAARYYGDPSLWRAIATYNGLDDPARIPPGTALRIPPAAPSAS
jgi:hypothetical protein